MQLEIVSPERILLDGKVESITVPGKEGKFQILNNHAAIVSVLEKGYIIFETDEKLSKVIRENFIKGSRDELSLKIDGGVVEMKENKVIILVD